MEDSTPREAPASLFCRWCGFATPVNDDVPGMGAKPIKNPGEDFLCSVCGHDYVCTCLALVDRFGNCSISEFN